MRIAKSDDVDVGSDALTPVHRETKYVDGGHIPRESRTPALAIREAAYSMGLPSL